eukprot:243928-Pleurochrysis_carterae.AAC.2
MYVNLNANRTTYALIALIVSGHPSPFSVKSVQKSLTSILAACDKVPQMRRIDRARSIYNKLDVDVDK